MAEISPLRRRMIEDMTVRNLSPATQPSLKSRTAHPRRRGDDGTERVPQWARICGLAGSGVAAEFHRRQEPPRRDIQARQPISATADDHLTDAFLRGLAEVGHVEGRNIAVEYRFAENQHDRLPALAQLVVGHLKAPHLPRRSMLLAHPLRGVFIAAGQPCTPF